MTGDFTPGQSDNRKRLTEVMLVGLRNRLVNRVDTFLPTTSIWQVRVTRPGSVRWHGWDIHDAVAPRLAASTKELLHGMW